VKGRNWHLPDHRDRQLYARIFYIKQVTFLFYHHMYFAFQPCIAHIGASYLLGGATLDCTNQHNFEIQVEPHFQSQNVLSRSINLLGYNCSVRD